MGKESGSAFGAVAEWVLKGALLGGLTLAIAARGSAAISSRTQTDGWVRLAGEVPAALQRATPVMAGTNAADRAQQPLTLTLVLRRDDEAGFQRYLRQAYDPHSKRYRRFMTPAQLSARFGPSRAGYEAVLGYLRGHGFELIQGSKNRMTLTVRGTRAQAQRAFALQLRDYRLGGTRFIANDRNPALPAAIARHVLSISGLSDLARPQSARLAIFFAVCANIAQFTQFFYQFDPRFGGSFDTPIAANSNAARLALLKAFAVCINEQSVAAGMGVQIAADPPPPAWQGVDGSGQTVGLLEFDTFHLSDVADYLSLIGFPAERINNVSQVPVNGGAGPQPGPDEDEVLLDIADVLSVAPGAKIAVYEGPFTGPGTSFQAMFNAMIDGGVDIISNSWAYCEDQTTLADVQGIDAILQTAAASGISVFNGSGDSGSRCLDGSPDTVSVPADSPSATAVGGSSLTLGDGFSYQSETWWDGAAGTPPTGQGGFGVSKFFARPSYQDGVSQAVGRSVPDVVSNADPFKGVAICAADLGGCPTGALYGGTSSAAPTWAAFAALLNQAQGTRLGALNPLLYPLAGTDAFHGAASMGSDFAHVGLGSPNLARLHQRLTRQTVGAVDAAVSQVRAFGRNGSLVPPAGGTLVAPADGKTPAVVSVRLADANGNPVGGKTVSLTVSGSATVTPASAVTGADDGIATFQLTDLSTETVNVTASGDGVTLSESPTIAFLTPPAAAASLTVSRQSVTADGIDSADVIVTLRDGLNRPTPGKLVNLTQTGSSNVTAPVPSVTDANGQVKFSVADQRQETVTYSAIDVSDGLLPVPGTGTVIFSNASGNGCGTVPVAGDGFQITPFAFGFTAHAFSFGNINTGCNGPTRGAFDASGALFVADGPTGAIFRFDAGGGQADSAHLITPTPLDPGIASVAITPDGRLYATQEATTGDFSTGAIVEVDPVTGGVVRTVASNITCAFGLAVDPISGDLFTDDGCGGAGSDNTSIWRISNPASATPTVSVYASTTKSANAPIVFAPDGTMYLFSGGDLVRVSGTNQPQPATVTTLPGVQFTGLGLAIGRTLADGSAQSLYMTTGNNLAEVDLTTSPVSVAQVLIKSLSGAIGYSVIGPDGCLYASADINLLRVTDLAGTCNYARAASGPTLSLDPLQVSPNPQQGTAETFTAALHFASVPSGTPVTFAVSGANPQIHLARTDANGRAQITYTALHAGDDLVTASIAVGGKTVVSNAARVSWDAGAHTTFLTLDRSPRGATAGRAVTVVAALTDQSVDPAVAVAGQSVDFTLGTSSCSATTDADGTAGCTLTPGASQVGSGQLSARFAGSTGLLASSDAVGFKVVAAPSAPTVTIAVTPTRIQQGASATLTWSSTDTDTCTASGAWSGAQAISGSLTVTPASAGMLTYTLSCSGPGGSANASATLTVQAAPRASRGGAMGLAWLAFGALAGLRRRLRRAGRGRGRG